VAAPTPPNRKAEDVVSIYSGKYTNLTGTKIGKNWGEATIASDILVQNDLTKQLIQFNYQGIVLESPTNLSGFEKLHVDFYKADQAQIKLSVIHVGGGDITKLLSISNPGWNSFDIPLSDFSGLNLSQVHQLKLEGAPTQGITTVFFDNLYFYKGSSLGLQSKEASKVRGYPNPANHILFLEATENILTASVLNLYGQEVISVNPGTNTTNLNIDHLSKGTYLLRTTFDNKVSISKFVKE
jgi:hypothetical protein